MRKIVILLTLLFIMTNCSTTSKSKSAGKVSQPSGTETKKAAPVEPASQEATLIIGAFDPERLKQEPYSSWYTSGYDDYQIKSEVLNSLLDIAKENITIKIVMGTWCPDSRREVPRMMRIFDIWRFPISQISFIGVDRKKNANLPEFESLKIERVPTFIIYKNNIEAGRIIETPKTSLEQDLVNILTVKSNN
jgi:thiol-disulfide isomerase/thioredoxin